MLRIIIVDDEASIREGLAKMIGKESSRFLIAGSFSNGQEALGFISAEEIDLVITDIRMPLVDGLELIKEVKMIRPETNCIIMSGFTDFEYARQALLYAAVDYMLKPINKKQLFERLYALDEEKTASLKKEQQYRSGLLLPYLKTTLSHCSRLPELVLPQPYFSVLALKANDMDTLRSSVRRLQRQEQCCFDPVDADDQILAMVCYYSHEPGPEDIVQFAERLRQFPHSGGIVNIGASPGYDNPVLLGKAFLEAKRACDHGIYCHSCWNLIHFSEAADPYQDAALLFAGCRETLVQDLQLINIPQIVHGLEALFEQLRERKADMASILHLCRLIDETAFVELQEWGELYSEGAAKALEEQLLACMSFDEMKRLFIGELTETLEHIRSVRMAQAGKSVETVKRWIKAHYDQPAELGSLARMVYLTPSYLSKLFKHETGMTITDYLIEVRIKKAKLLLKHSSDMKIHEIGSEVGYPDPAYFNKLFKRMVGITPNEYRRRVH